MKKTLVNVKIRVGRRAREVWHLTAMLIGFAALLGILAFAQVEMCWKLHRHWTALECLRSVRRP